MNTADETALEAMIDAHGLADVLGAVSRICHEKSAHVAQYATHHAGPDSTASAWTRAGNAVARAGDGAAVARVSP
jgi:hypothetical protein